MAERPEAPMTDLPLSQTCRSAPLTAEGAFNLGVSWRLGLDWAERILVLGWYAFFVWRLVPDSLMSANWLLIASESLVIMLLVFRRRATAISLRPTDWLLAMGATLSPLCVAPGANSGQYVAPLACAIVMIAGLIIQIRAKVSLGRRMGMVPADRGIHRGGPYQLVRHPMYAGYLLTDIGFFLLNPTLWNASVYAIAMVLQILRILAEERFLAQNAEYREYMQSVRYRLIPGIF